MQNKNFTILLVLLMGFFSNFSHAQSSSDVLGYIARYKDLAIAEMRRTGIPAAITLAQGIHETEAGTSELVRKSNNHFGIKCKDNWGGESVFHDDDARGECFRKYSAPEDSYRDHSDFLRTRSNYTSLFRLDPTDYEAWANGLKKAGYATNPKYAQILIKLIEDYHLEDFTLIAMSTKSPTEDLVKNDAHPEEKVRKDQGNLNTKDNIKVISAPGDKASMEKNHIVAAVMTDVNNYPSGEFKINDTRVVFVKKGSSYLTIAQQFEIPLERLFDFNDIKQQEVTVSDQLVFIQRKRKTGEHEFHTVQPGETVNSIAQTEAIRLESLLEYNSLGAGMQPAIGETIYLHSKSSSVPKLATGNPVAENSKNNSRDISKSDSKIQEKIFFTHTVQPKETLFSIAKKYNVTASNVMSWNQISSNDVKVGQSLKIYR